MEASDDLRPDRPIELHHPLAGDAGFDDDGTDDLVALGGFGRDDGQGKHACEKKGLSEHRENSLLISNRRDAPTMRPSTPANGKRVVVKALIDA